MTATEILAVLADARRAVAAGDLIDLGGLEATVEAFCGRAPTAAELVDLTAALDGLAADITVQQSALRQAEALEARGRAAGAYGRPVKETR